MLFIVTTAVMADVTLPTQVLSKPEKCPSVSSIITEGLNYVEKNGETYIAAQVSRYGTSDTWGFVVWEIAATSTEDALNKGQNALSSLSYRAGPTYIASENVWACLYHTANGYKAAALTPINVSGIKVVPHLLKND
jgi:hypothetical protein